MNNLWLKCNLNLHCRLWYKWAKITSDRWMWNIKQQNTPQNRMTSALSKKPKANIQNSWFNFFYGYLFLIVHKDVCLKTQLINPSAGFCVTKRTLNGYETLSYFSFLSTTHFTFPQLTLRMLRYRTLYFQATGITRLRSSCYKWGNTGCIQTPVKGAPVQSLP